MTDQQAPVIIGCDHAAFELKEKIKSLLIDRGIPVEDVGTTGMPRSIKRDLIFSLSSKAA